MFLRNLHLIVGTLGLVLFILQGHYMANVIDVPAMTDTQRMLYRSAHIYFLTACGMNVCIGYYQNGSDLVSWPGRLASVLILLAPGMLLFSFFTEINTETIDRVILSLGLYALFGGAAILATSAIYQRLRSGKNKT